MRDAVLEYQEVLERRVVRRELATTSFTAYRRDLAEFETLAGPGTILDDLESDDIEAALTRIAQAPDRRYTRGTKIAGDGSRPPGRNAHSLSRWFTSVKGLFAWATEHGYVQIDPMSRLSTPRTPRRATGARLGLPVDAALNLRDAAARPRRANPTAQQRLALRDLAILRLMVESGPRVSEVCGANRESITVHDETGRPVLRVHGKGSKPRALPLSPATAAAIDDYLTQERPAPPTPKDPHDRREHAKITDASRALFVSVRGWRLNARDIERMIERLAQETLGRRITPHGLRHTALTALARSGVDIATVAQIAGHASLSTTSVYMDDSMAAAAAAIDTSPLAVP